MVEKMKKQPSARIARKRQQARREILDSAQAILSESGPEAVTLASVAGRLGMTKQSLYHYFASKEALIRGLVITLLDAEIESLLNAIARRRSNKKVLGVLIQAFYSHYIDNLDAFRIVYCQSQLYSSSAAALDEMTLRDEIHPRTRQLFDVLEERIAGEDASKVQRRSARRLAYTAWTSALGLMTMLGVADATDDPVVHSDKELVKTLSDIFNAAQSTRN
jgi:AcrR family transcriptional regulator